MFWVIKHYQLIDSMEWIISGPGCMACRSFREGVKRTENAPKQNEFHYQICRDDTDTHQKKILKTVYLLTKWISNIIIS